MTAKLLIMHIDPILIRFAVFLGAMTKNGRDQRDKKRKKHPVAKRPMKYGYISVLCYRSAAYD